MPINRGFDTHVGYLNGAENYHYGCATATAGGSGHPSATCSADPSVGRHDLWEDEGPAVEAVPKVVYSADFYTARAVELVEKHPSATPFFMYFAIQNVHAPYQLPPADQVAEYPAMGDKFHTYANMLHMLDEAVANLTAALQKNKMWESTLMLFTADNGGTLTFGNNYPLHGHKHDPWEGGTRVTAFLAGGFVPSELRGRSSDALVHISDWYPTFAKLAGASPVDSPVIGGAARPIDGADVWPLLTGKTTSQPRAVTVVTEVSAIEVVDEASPDVEGDGGKGQRRFWKLIVLAGQSNTYTKAGEQVNGTAPCLAARQPDPPQPGRTDPIVNGPAHDEHARACAVCNATAPCLFDVLSDAQETTNVAALHPDIVARLSKAIAAANAAVFTNGSLGDGALAAYTKVDESHWGGFDGPCYLKKNETKRSSSRPASVEAAM